MSPNSSALSLCGISKHYRRGLLARRVEVLGGLDLELAPGARLGLVGPNGAGKSTCLRIAAGVEPASSGSVAVFGRPPRELEPRRRTGFLPDGAPFPGELTARACLELCAGIQGLRGAGARGTCGRMLERVGLASVRGRLASFSQGMLRRFALAQAFVCEPDLLLLDEPTAGLDAEGHVVLEELLAEAHARGTALVLCSHHLDEVLAWTDEISVLAGGTLHARAELEIDSGAARLEIEGLDEPAFAELEQWIAGRGGRITARSPTTRALLSVYAELGEGER